MKTIKNIVTVLVGVFCLVLTIYILTKFNFYMIGKFIVKNPNLILSILNTIFIAITVCLTLVSWRFSTFNSVFTQLISGHRDVYQKTIDKDGTNPFTKFYTSFESLFKTNDVISKICICSFYRKYLGLNLNNCTNTNNNNISSENNNKPSKDDCINAVDPVESINMCAYFKYIYHEVCFIDSFIYLNSDQKQKYISIIQAQMTNHELFCYLINQIEHENKEYHQILKKNKFFDNLHESVLSSVIDKIPLEERQKLINL